jgi:hypothetical protein
MADGTIRDEDRNDRLHPRRTDATISGQSTSSVTRWLRLVGAP